MEIYQVYNGRTFLKSFLTHGEAMKHLRWCEFHSHPLKMDLHIVVKSCNIEERRLWV